MSELTNVPLEEATQKQLLFYANSILNLDVGHAANSSTLRAKILRAQPDCTEIKVKADDQAKKAAPAAPTVTSAKVEKKVLTTHYQDDPKVKIKVFTDSSGLRPKDVQIAVQGDVVIIQRDKEVSIPYRHYLALNDAIEDVARDTDEINPNTGLPIKEWVSQHSYPFQVLTMPSREEIAAWERRTGSKALV